MIYSTSGEFIQALKDYKVILEKAEEWKKKYRDLHYQRYEKVRSPLDYDIIGYKNGEPVRQIKRGGFNPDSVRSYQENLDIQLEKALDEYSKLKVKAENVLIELKMIEEPLKSLLIMRYMEHKKLKEVCKKSDLYLDESGMYKYITKHLEKYYE